MPVSRIDALSGHRQFRLYERKRTDAATRVT
jgi:hypothetical protein